MSFVRKEAHMHMYSAEDELCDVKIKLMELQGNLKKNYGPGVTSIPSHYNKQKLKIFQLLIYKYILYEIYIDIYSYIFIYIFIGSLLFSGVLLICFCKFIRVYQTLAVSYELNITCKSYRSFFSLSPYLLFFLPSVHAELWLRCPSPYSAYHYIQQFFLLHFRGKN